MPADLFHSLDAMLDTGATVSGLDYLIDQFKTLHKYPLLFEARLMKKRFDLGLPLIQTQAPSEFPPHLRATYEEAMVEAAREAGELFLAEGEIERAWPYFRAIGETEPIAVAIERTQPGENTDGLIAIAFQEGVNPAKGLELILAQHGMCRAITSFGMYAVQKDRERCLAMLARNLHEEIADRMGRAIESVEGARPQTVNLIEMFAERPWLFGEYDYYVDTSHLVSLLQYCTEIKDLDTLELLHQFCEYGQHLSSNFQSRGEPPFENPFVDYGHYVEAVRGIVVDAHVAHFHEKLSEAGPEEAVNGPAQVLINLLVRLGRFEEALQISLEWLPEGETHIPCPSVSQLCYMARDYSRLKELAHSRGDALTYLAARATEATSIPLRPEASSESSVPVPAPGF